MTQESLKGAQAPKTMYDKIWENHLVYQEPGDDSAIIYVDQLLCHEVTSPQAFEGLRMASWPTAKTYCVSAGGTMK